MSVFSEQFTEIGVQTLRTRDTSDPRHFGTSAAKTYRHCLGSRHGAEVSWHIGTDVLQIL